MSATKANRLRGEWVETKITMMQWIRKTISMMPEGQKASDVKDMVAACGQLIKMLGDMGAAVESEDDGEKDVVAATKEIKKGIKKIANLGIFNGGDDE